MIKQMSPADVRELLGISRSAMRYYMSKGLISAKKNEENGYSYFSGNDLLELIDVAYYRNCMDADADDIKRLTFAPSLTEMEANYEEEIDAYEKKIKKQLVYLDMLRDFDKQIKRAIKCQNKIREVYLDAPFYLYYPELDRNVNVRADHFQVSYWVSEFAMEGDGPVYKRSSMMVGVEFVETLDTDFPGIPYQKIFGGNFLYTSFCSERELNDVAMLEPVVAYAKTHGYKLAEPMFIRYLLTFRKEGVGRCHCYEVYLPIV